MPPAAKQPVAPQPANPECSGGRQVLIVLAVVLALLVLLCAGVISFLLKQSNTSLGTPRTQTAVATGVVDEGTSAASYRLSNQVGGLRGLDPASEGRQTL